MMNILTWYRSRPRVLYNYKWSQPKFKRLKRLGFLSLAGSLAGFLLLLTPLMTPLLRPTISKNPDPSPSPMAIKEVKQESKPIIEDFLVTIDRIGLQNARVIKDIDPADTQTYEAALLQGLVQAKGTGYPGSGKMVYIFGHSTNYPWYVKELNALFFKLETIEIGDDIKIEYNGAKFKYYVTQKKIVEANDVSSVYDNLNSNILVLQTCYPPGTSWKRLLIFAVPSGFGSVI
jgi:LPXTG-site transpeptidase (sortase) family protein